MKNAAIAMQKGSRYRLTGVPGATYPKRHGPFLCFLCRRHDGLLLSPVGVWIGTLALISLTHPPTSGWVLYSEPIP
jgi:hypothetical protein